MSINVVVSFEHGVTDAVHELDKLAETLKSEGCRVEQRPFDGESVVQMLVGISSLSLPYFKLWIENQVSARTSFKVAVNGIELTGYNASEVQKIFRTIEQEIEDDDA